MTKIQQNDLAKEKIHHKDKPARGFRKKVIYDRAGEHPYLVRWTLFTVPFLGWELKLHKILRPDSEVCSHCHPWSFMRMILSNSYWETRGDDKQTLHHVKGWWPKFCPADFLHSIRKTENDKPVWTIVMTFGVVQGWGFLTTDGLLPWRTFVDASPETRVAWCEDEDEKDDIGDIPSDSRTSFREAIDLAQGKSESGTVRHGYA